MIGDDKLEKTDKTNKTKQRNKPRRKPSKTQFSTVGTLLDKETKENEGGNEGEPAGQKKSSTGSTDPKEKGPQAKEQPSGKHKRPLLPNGFLIDGISTEYKVLSLLGSGGFGDVYEVEQMSTGNKYALKTEDSNIDRRLSRLKIEALLLELCSKATSKEHFLNLIEKGRVGNNKFIIMPIVGQAIDKVRKDLLSGNQFTRYTAWNIAFQMMESVRDLHSIFYLHRDLKPQNFAIGKGDAVRKVVYMLDFGIARKFVDSAGKLLVPRCTVKFMGTIRYASRAGHRNMDQSRKDDIEAMCYVIADIFHEYSLTWRGKLDPVELIKLKDGFMRNQGIEIQTVYEMELLPPVMKKFCALVNDINAAAVNIDYEGLLKTLKEAEPPAATLDWLNEPMIAKYAQEKADRLAKMGSKTNLKK